MLAFAGNSILCRAALKSSGVGQAKGDLENCNMVPMLIDPATYTLVRIVFGAMMLFAIQSFRMPKSQSIPLFRKIAAPVALTVYALGFSFAYVGLDAASGTLILFAFVQITMLSVGLLKKEYPSIMEWLGLLVAMAGLVYLVFPKIETPLIWEAMLMAMAGVAWGFYSVLGKGSADSISDTARNFIYSVPIVVLVFALMTRGSGIGDSPTEVAPHGFFIFGNRQISWSGFWLAAGSGAIASGLGYVLWYTVLPYLKSSQAAAVQLSVPIIAAVGGAIVSGDSLTQRTMLSGAIILGGIALTVKWKKKA